MKKAGQLEHRDRKNPRSREVFEKAREDKNKARGKQIFDEETKTWHRTNYSSLSASA